MQEMSNCFTANDHGSCVPQGHGYLLLPREELCQFRKKPPKWIGLSRARCPRDEYSRVFFDELSQMCIVMEFVLVDNLPFVLEEGEALGAHGIWLFPPGHLTHTGSRFKWNIGVPSGNLCSSSAGTGPKPFQMNITPSTCAPRI